MTKMFLVVAATGIFLTAMTQADNTKKEIVGLKPEEVRWSTPPYYTDGRQRAQMLGDSSQGGAWVDRVKIPAGGRVLAHTHPRRGGPRVAELHLVRALLPASIKENSTGTDNKSKLDNK